MVEKGEQLIQAARAMRNQPTKAEDALWRALRDRKLGGLKFRRQHVISSIIVDYYCAAARLVIEVDGEIHDFQMKYDSERTRVLEDHGSHVIRFSNEMILNNLDEVLSEIERVALERILEISNNTQNNALTPYPSPVSGRGEEATLTPNLQSKGAREQADLTSALTPSLQRDSAASSTNYGRGEEAALTPHLQSDCAGEQAPLPLVQGEGAGV